MSNLKKSLIFKGPFKVEMRPAIYGVEEPFVVDVKGNSICVGNGKENANEVAGILNAWYHLIVGRY